MKMNQLKIDVQGTLGKEFYCVETSVGYHYEDNKRTDKITGIKYVVAIPKLAFEKLSVLVLGQEKPIFELETGDMIPVKFEGLEATPYLDNNRQLQLSLKATSVVEVQE